MQVGLSPVIYSIARGEPLGEPRLDTDPSTTAVTPTCLELGIYQRLAIV